MKIEVDHNLTTMMNLGATRFWRTRSFLVAAMLANIVSVEGFLNLVYHLFTKPDLADDQVKSRIEREPLDLKLRLLDTYCDCFETTPIDRNSELYKAFLHLVSIRINFAHAKLTAAMDEPVIIEEDEFPFLVPRDAQSKYGISSDPLALNREMVAGAGRIVRTLVRQIIRSMKPEVRYPFAIVHRYESIQYKRDEDGRAKIILHPEEDFAPDEWVDEMLEGEGDEWKHPSPPVRRKRTSKE